MVSRKQVIIIFTNFDRAMISAMTQGFQGNHYKGFRTLAEARAEWELTLVNGTWGPLELQPHPPQLPTFDPNECYPNTTGLGMSVAQLILCDPIYFTL